MPISGLLPALFSSALLRDTAQHTDAPPPVGAGAGHAGAVPDVVVFSSAPLRLLSELASAGLRQLATLLPALEQAVEERSPVPLGHLAKAAGAAARQVEEGHVALFAEGPDRVAAALTGELRARAAAPDQATQLLRTLARQIGSGPPQATETRASESLRTISRQVGEIGLPPETPHPDQATQLLRTLARQIGAFETHAADDHMSDTVRAMAHEIDEAFAPEEKSPGEPASPAHRWLDEAQNLLRRTGDALDKAGEQLRPLVADASTPSPQAGWALVQIAAAQVQLASATTRLGAVPKQAIRGAARWAIPSLSIPFERLAGAASLVGMMLLLGMLWLVDGIWSLAMGVAGLCATAFWVFRISQAARGVTLDGKR